MTAKCYLYLHVSCIVILSLIISLFIYFLCLVFWSVSGPHLHTLPGLLQRPTWHLTLRAFLRATLRRERVRAWPHSIRHHQRVRVRVPGVSCECFSSACGLSVRVFSEVEPVHNTWVLACLYAAGTHVCKCLYENARSVCVCLSLCLCGV